MFNFSGTRLHFQGHSSKDNFSSLTIHAVIYLLNKYLLRAHYCQGISKSDQQPLRAPTFQTRSSLSLALWQSDREAGVY